MRFISEDTNRGDVKNPLSLNLYTYCVGNPITYYDKTGNGPELVALVFIPGIGEAILMASAGVVIVGGVAYLGWELGKLIRNTVDNAQDSKLPTGKEFSDFERHYKDHSGDFSIMPGGNGKKPDKEKF